LAWLYLAKEELGRLTVELEQQQHGQRRQRDESARALAELRRELHEVEQQRHTQELHLTELGQRIQTLADRMQEDYELDLVALASTEAADAETAGAEGALVATDGAAEGAPQSDETPAAAEAAVGTPAEARGDPLEGRAREEVEAEIEQLRRKLAGLGAVNLESLRELEDLETRAGVLTHQREDLVRAIAAQEEILRKISAESRKLFAATLDAVRSHFEELFRKLFGGGRADIVLEDEEDVLESGIEIIARPPGKEPRSISQLSGGEKTLTAVAILLAIFRSRPSPFCVLDEVDAALDEGNVDRFVVVLNEFLSWTQFILITHCKRTMTCAGVLYGITMQESGVSKRVAVRFEDVSEDGRFEVREGTEEAVAQAGDNGRDDSEEQDDEGPPFVQQGGPHWKRAGVPQPEESAVDESEEAE
jgi:chromosome segregation protein